MLPAFSIELARQFNNSTEQFPIDLELAWQWVGYSRRNHGLDVLEANFVVSEDFHVTVVNSTQRGGRPIDAYFLTIECFKMLAVLADTAEGKLVRRYFLECEEQLKSLNKSVEE